MLGVLRLAREVAPHQRAVSVAAGLIAAVHPTLVYAATHVQVALAGRDAPDMDTCVCIQDRDAADGCRTRSSPGALLARLTLCDPILALAGAGALWAIVQGESAGETPRTQATRLAALVVLTAAAGIAPWIVRNALVHGEFVAIKSTFGYAFWQGNCALSEGTDKVVRASVEQVLDQGKSQSGLAALNRSLWAARHEAGYIDDIALTRRGPSRCLVPSPSPSDRGSCSGGRSTSCATAGQILAALPASVPLLLAVRRDQSQDAGVGLPDQPSGAHDGRPARVWGSPPATFAEGCGRRS